MNKVNMYHTNIEAILVENISNANDSIIIIMAWFTSKVIKDALITVKTKKPKINIKIVVDTNEINDKYFLNYKDKFESIGIQIFKKVNNSFLHDKILVIDSLMKCLLLSNFQEY